MTRINEASPTSTEDPRVAVWLLIMQWTSTGDLKCEPTDNTATDDPSESE